jgi:hypothetical protein
MTEGQVREMYVRAKAMTEGAWIDMMGRALLAASAPNPSDKQEADELKQIYQEGHHDGYSEGYAAGMAMQAPSYTDFETWLKGPHARTQTMVDAFDAGKRLAQSAEQDRIDAEYREVGVWEPDGSKFKTYRNENLNGVAMYAREAAREREND